MRNIIYILIFFGSRLFSQEPVFSDFYNNPIYLNPALAGQYQIRASFNANNQWYNIPGQLNTQTFSLDGSLSTKKWTDVPNPVELILGMYVLNNHEGELGMKFNDYSLLLGTKFTKSNHSLSIPIQLAYVTKQLDLSNAVFMQNLDPVFGNIYTSNFIRTSLNRSHIDFHSGFNYSYINRIKSYDSKLDFGIAFHNLIGTHRDGFLSHNAVNRLKTTIYFSFLKKGLGLIGDLRFSGFYQRQVNQQTVQFSSHIFPNFGNMGNGRTFLGTGIFFRQQFLNTSLVSDPTLSFETIYFPLFILLRKKEYIFRFSFSHGFCVSELAGGNPGGIGEITLLIIKNSDNHWDFCPGDKQVRNELSKKQKKGRNKLNKRRNRVIR